MEKKEYIPPELTIIDLKTESQLLCESGEDENCEYNDGPFN